MKDKSDLILTDHYISIKDKKHDDEQRLSTFVSYLMSIKKYTKEVAKK